MPASSLALCPWVERRFAAVLRTFGLKINCQIAHDVQRAGVPREAQANDADHLLT